MFNFLLKYVGDLGNSITGKGKRNYRDQHKVDLSTLIMTD